ncbi:MAG: hypothetical protein M1833_003456 [Piccolia ochrophora]|nr:MAG: hypothetical protein M1833_003456 [Piccolia ochrophora]
MVESSLMTPQDTQTLVSSIRAHGFDHKASKVEINPPAQSFLLNVMSDLMHDKIPPHPLASSNILLYWTVCSDHTPGVEFWEQIRNRNSDWTNARTYGAAIELLAAHGKSLSYLEELYGNALKLFSGTSVEYHLSSHAILPDRRAMPNIRGLSTSLLQGIIIARLKRDDWRKAYLGLDTLLRLHPVPKTRVLFETFLIGRPLLESYKIFLMACRSNYKPSRRATMHLLARMAKACSSPQDLATTMLGVLAMWCIVRVHVGATGKLEPAHVSTLVDGVSSLLGHSLDAEMVEILGTDDVFNAVLPVISRLSHLARSSGPHDHQHLLHHLILDGARLRRGDVVSEARSQLSRHGLEPNAFTHRALLLAAGNLGDFERLQECWISLVARRLSSGDKGDTELEFSDWSILHKACSAVGRPDYAKAQFVQHSSRMNLKRRYSIAELIARDPVESEEWDPFLPANTVTIPSSTLLGSILKHVGQGEELRTPYLPARTSIIGILSGHGSDMGIKLRRLYDDLTTDPLAKEATFPQDEFSATELNGDRLDATRYQNWLLMSELIVDAEKNSMEKEQRETQAVAQDKSPSASLDQPFVAELFAPPDQELLEAEASNLQCQFPKVEALVSDALRLRGYDHKYLLEKHGFASRTTTPAN